MVKNYYKILAIPTTSSIQEIREGFKRMVLKWHPKKTKFPIEEANKEFSLACEAYDILSTPEFRAVYDAYGYDTLVGGITKDGEIIFAAYEFKSSPEEIYRRFVLESNPFANIIDIGDPKCVGSMFGYACLGKYWETEEKPINIQVSVLCTLEELFLGCVKSLKYERSVFDATRTSTCIEMCDKEIVIKPGYYQGLKLVYKGEGSDKMNCRRGDLIVTVNEKEHTRFKREKHDLHVSVSIGLHECLNTSCIEIENLDRCIHTISIDKIISPQLVITLTGFGMPILDQNKRGNLHVHFDIVFPEKIPESHLEELRSLLPN